MVTDSKETSGADRRTFLKATGASAAAVGLAGTEGTKECVWPEKHATADHVPAPWIPTG